MLLISLGMYLTSHLLLGVTLTLPGLFTYLFWISCCVLLLPVIVVNLHFAELNQAR